MQSEGFLDSTQYITCIPIFGVCRGILTDPLFTERTVVVFYCLLCYRCACCLFYREVEVYNKTETTATCRGVIAACIRELSTRFSDCEPTLEGEVAYAVEAYRTSYVN